MVTLDDFRDAQYRISGKVRRTPIVTLQPLRDAPPVTFKLELFQHTGSFKVRGVFNKLASLQPEQLRRGVISMSSGNHAQAVAFAAGQYGIPATLIMPAWSTRSKVAATRSLGAEVVLTEGDLIQLCQERQQAHDLTLIHPFDDPAIIAGAGTLGLEILEDLPQPDLVLVSVGGGGLISGVAGAIRQSSPGTRIIGIEPEGADVMSQSLRVGQPLRSQVKTIADGLAAPFVGKHTLEHVQEYVDEILTVTDEEILESLCFLIEHCRTWVEPAAAAAFVPIMHKKLDWEGINRVVCILCGANLDLDRLQSLLARDGS